MSTNQGIFEAFPSPPIIHPDSPFEVLGEPPVPVAAASPFAAVPRVESPFTVVDQASQFQPVEPGRPARVPERRQTESPFQVADASESFGFEAPAQASVSPFTIERQRGRLPITQATPAAFVPPALAPVPLAAIAVREPQSDSFAIRQLELRAIFGVDRELNPDEILQRARSLPGLRLVARVGPQDKATLESLKQLLPNLGIGSASGLRLFADSLPLEFIREGAVMLAVQTDGGFMPGVRETLMLVARELDRLS